MPNHSQGHFKQPESFVKLADHLNSFPQPKPSPCAPLGQHRSPPSIKQPHFRKPYLYYLQGQQLYREFHTQHKRQCRGRYMLQYSRKNGLQQCILTPRPSCGTHLCSRLLEYRRLPRRPRHWRASVQWWVKVYEAWVPLRK